ncbi:MAG: hypothetical protein FD181_1856 [Prolixibacteraceae bacterium]|nr:MAG: hypothetical protein FD181_1856 [Prolixibacteraceae bacterium]
MVFIINDIRNLAKIFLYNHTCNILIINNRFFKSTL